jgi:hypothetical protein
MMINRMAVAARAIMLAAYPAACLGGDVDDKL